MNKINNCLVCFVVFALLLASCKKEDDGFFIKEGSFSSGLTASSDNITLAAAQENATAVAFSWGKANFGEKPVIRYTLQLDVPSDTSGANGWANAKNYTVDNGLSAYSFIVKDLNNILNTMGLPAGAASSIVFRVKADVPQNTGAVSSIAPAYSNTVPVSITSYATSLHIPGEYQGWNPGTAPLLNPVAGRPGMYEGYVYMPGTGIKYFKYTNAPDWDHINYGDGGNGSFSTDGNAGGLNVPDGGYYELTADLNTNKWTATKTTWSIIGDATPGGWDNDTQMAYDEANQVWTITCNMTNAGSFKFRANNQWVIDFGLDNNTGRIEYADNPFFGYRDGLWNLSVPEAGNYTITLDLHISQHYTYTLHKN